MSGWLLGWSLFVAFVLGGIIGVGLFYWFLTNDPRPEDQPDLY
jgi:hypothetical protein